MLNFLAPCRICPHECGVHRNQGELGFCKLDDGLYISSICIHHGEEPPISGPKGICNVFFAHCNLQCVYCQNSQISNNETNTIRFKHTLDDVVLQITAILDAGIQSLGFVSPSHQIPQMISIIEALWQKGYKPIVVFNTNSYDKVSTLQQLKNYVDVYLADYKYADNNLGKRFSQISDYQDIALEAIKEMVRQKGLELIINKGGIAEKGVIVRHLVLPGQIANSCKVLKNISVFIDSKINLSLMSQYYPAGDADKYSGLNRTLTEAEYNEIVDFMEECNFENGWVQDLDSENNYRPDFDKSNPFI